MPEEGKRLDELILAADELLKVLRQSQEVHDWSQCEAPECALKTFEEALEGARKC